MKSRKQKLDEYSEKYKDIPLNYEERLAWMYDKYNITLKKADEILIKRDQMLNSLYYKDILIVLYEEPEGSPRPRFRLVNRKNLVNMAMANPNFIHVYSPTGAQDNLYMKRLVSDKEFIELEQLLCTPCNVEYITYHKTPSSFSKTDTFLAEIGIIRPLSKPDWDNIGKKYSDMSNKNIWLDDIFVIDGTVRKFYSILPRIEIRLRYMNMVYNKYQYNIITNRADFTDNMTLEYFKGD